MGPSYLYDGNPYTGKTAALYYTKRPHFKCISQGCCPLPTDFVRILVHLFSYDAWQFLLISCQTV